LAFAVADRRRPHCRLSRRGDPRRGISMMRAPRCGISRWHVVCKLRFVARRRIHPSGDAAAKPTQGEIMKTSRTPSMKMIAIAVATLLPLGAAVAGDKDKDKSGYAGASFDTLDTNRDGKLSQAEATADTTVVFSSADVNGDGYLDKTEWKNRAKAPMSPAPQSAPEPSSDATVPPAPDTETPRQ
jgi:EF hand domain-containing protein